MADMLVRDLIHRALRQIGTIAAGDDPEAVELTDALSSYNSMVRSLFGSGVGPRLTPIVTAANTTVENGAVYQVGEAAITLTLPVNPKDGNRFGVAPVPGGSVANSVTINTNNSAIEGAVTNVVMPGASLARTWFFRADTRNWERERDQVLTDLPFFPPDMMDALVAMLAMRLSSEYGPEPTQTVQALADQGRIAFTRRYSRHGRFDPRQTPGRLDTRAAMGRATI